MKRTLLDLIKRRGVSAILGASAAIAGTAALAWQFGMPAPASQGRPLPGRFAGVNFAGAEGGAKHLPGRYGFDYSYPDAKIIAPFLHDGFTAARLPFRWERLQPRALGPLDPTELARLDAAIESMRGFQVIILDAHNYANYAHQRLDRPPASAAWLADLWAKLAVRYAGNPRIAFGIMNEPFGISASDWRAIVDTTVAAIRRTSARNLILIPGTNYTGAHSWTRLGTFSNAAAMAGFHDPAGNFAFELHQYLDIDSSGTHVQCVDPKKAADRLTAVTDWLRRQHGRGVLAEFGASADPQCIAGLSAMLSAIDAASDVWLGWTYWAAGGRWGNYAFSVQPNHGAMKPQIAILLQHLGTPARR